MKNQWTVDPMHSEIEFKVKHLMISTVTGKFKSFEASAVTEGDEFEGANIKFSANVNSIDTGNEQRDGHLQSDDFFNAASFPVLAFVSTSMTKNAKGGFDLVGDLTIRDITKSVKLDVDFNGTMTDPYGNLKAGFELVGSINRKDFDLKWSATTEAGGIVVSDEVKLICNIQLAKIVA
jgi:polyisoprenoid-binding protein YceI